MACATSWAMPGANAEQQPTSNPQAQKQDSPNIGGKIVETMDSGGYTYIAFEKDGKKRWVAVPRCKVSVGEEVQVQPGLEMGQFTSRSLNRTFDSILFSGGLVKPSQAVDKEAEKKKAHESVPELKVDLANIKVEKAKGENAYTVGELFAKATELDSKKISVRGKVVKVSKGIMGRNWLHLRDGSGNAAEETNNLVVTTQDITLVGDTLTATGTLRKDKDFGGGYFYKVIIEDTVLSP
jgi:hypothetical protein